MQVIENIPIKWLCSEVFSFCSLAQAHSLSVILHNLTANTGIAILSIMQSIMQSGTQVEQASGISRWWRLLGGLSMNIALGTLYAWSVFVAPLEEKFGWKRAETSMVFTIAVIVFALSFVVALDRRESGCGRR